MIEEIDDETETFLNEQHISNDILLCQSLLSCQYL